MTEREKLLQYVRMYDFALLEAGLFLDGHPKNSTALAYYEKTHQLYEQAVAEYQKRFGPLSAKHLQDTTSWRWIEDPWPWEGADN